jgi:hypothetical protein
MAAAAALFFAAGAGGQGVPRDQIDAYLDEGEVSKAEKALQGFLSRPENLSYQDSVYLLKNLGVLYASDPKQQAEAEKLFYHLLELDPFASLHDTYASHTILGRFKKIRTAFQRQKGGKALIPPVAVFDFQSAGFSADERANLTNQFIGEMQKLLIFHTLDRPFVTETLRRMRKKPETCSDRACLLDIARRLMVEYMVMAEVGRIDSVYTFQITFVAVETGRNSTVLRKVYTGELAKVLEQGLPDLARSLQDQEAAWLNLSVQPSNTSLVLDGTPLAAVDSRLPVNPGKHRVCGSSPGYETQCKDFSVKKMDAVTYSLVLPKVGGGAEPEVRSEARENWDEEPGTFSEDPGAGGGGKGPSKKAVAVILGGMAALALGLIVLWGAL